MRRPSATSAETKKADLKVRLYDRGGKQKGPAKAGPYILLPETALGPEPLGLGPLGLRHAHPDQGRRQAAPVDRGPQDDEWVRYAHPLVVPQLAHL